MTYLIAEEIFQNRIEESQSFHKSHQVDELNDEFLGIFGEFAVIVRGRCRKEEGVQVKEEELDSGCEN